MMRFLGWCWHNWGRWTECTITYTDFNNIVVSGQRRACVKCGKKQVRGT